ncbi:MAG: PEP-CTERM sorting domain-containing protein [Tepidisphaeraceae bacterium]
MYRFRIVVATLIILGAVASRAPAEVFFFFPALDSNGDLINPLNRNVITPAVTEVGIGFMGVNNQPNTPFFPNTGPDSTSLDIVNGGIIPSTVGLVVVANASSVNVNGGGEIDTETAVYDTSSVTVNGGATGEVELNDSSTFGITTGTVESVVSTNMSQASVSGGTVSGALMAADQASITITGGTCGSLLASDGGTINATGGGFGAGAVLAVLGTGESGAPSQVTVSNGGTVASVTAQDSGMITMNTGAITGDVSESLINSTNISGGTISLTNVMVGGSVSDSSGIISLTGTTVAGAATVSGSGATMSLDSGSTVGGQVTVSNGAQLTTSGQINGVFGVSVQDASMVMNGGSVPHGITLTGASTFTGGGTIGNFLQAQDETVVNLTSGTVDSALVNGASFEMSGGTISGDVNVFTNFLIQSGTIGGDLNAKNNGSVNVSGGNITGSVQALTSGTANITGGNIAGALIVEGTSFFSMTGGSVSQGAAETGLSQLEMTGGVITGNMHTTDTSALTITGGVVNGNIDSFDTSVISIEGTQASGPVVVSGTITTHSMSNLLLFDANIFGAVDADDSSSVTIDSGVAITGGVNATGLARVVITGTTEQMTNPTPANVIKLIPADSPTPLNEVFLYDQSSLQIDGLTFGADLLDPMNDNGMFSEYELSGTFPDGSSFPDDFLLFVENGSGASFQFVPVPVPEPAMGTLLMIGGACFGMRRRRRSR